MLALADEPGSLDILFRIVIDLVTADNKSSFLHTILHIKN